MSCVCVCVCICVRACVSVCTYLWQPDQWRGVHKHVTNIFTELCETNKKLKSTPAIEVHRTQTSCLLLIGKKVGTGKRQIEIKLGSHIQEELSQERDIATHVVPIWLCRTTPWLCCTTPWLCRTTPWLCRTTPWLCYTTPWLCYTTPWLCHTYTMALSYQTRSTRPWLCHTTLQLCCTTPWVYHKPWHSVSQTCSKGNKKTF